MSGRYSVASRNGNLRADSEDGRTLTLTVFDPAKPGAPYREWEGTVLLDDLRQIVAYFDGLNACDPAEAVIAALEQDPMLVRRFLYVLSRAERDAMSLRYTEKRS